MTKCIVSAFLIIPLFTSLAAQPPQGQPSGPQAKSQEEVNGLNLCMAAPDHDSRIEFCEQFLADFQKTEFKEAAYQLIFGAYQEKNDFENVLIYGEKTLEVNPDNAYVLVTMGWVIPLRTRQFDLDKDEKLSQAEGYAKRALGIVPTLPPPNPSVTEDDWLLAKKDLMSQAHEALGTIALKRRDYVQAEKAYRQSLAVSTKQTGTMFYQIAEALKGQKKYDEALSMLDQSIARGGRKLPNGKDAAEAMKAELTKLKTSGAAPQQ